MKAEKQLVALLSMPLGSRDAVTVLSLDQYPPLMSLLSRRTHKDMALKVVQTVLAQVRGEGGALIWLQVVCRQRGHDVENNRWDRMNIYRVCVCVVVCWHCG